MLYELIERSNLCPNPFVANKWHPSTLREQDFCSGRRVEKWPDSVRFIASNSEMDGDLDDFVVNNVPAPVITVRLLNLVSTLNVPAFQALPAEAVWSSGRRELVYVLNIEKLIPGLDMAHSDALYYDKDFPNAALRGKLNSIHTAALAPLKIGPWDLFRCQEYPDDLYASERFRTEFERRKMTGVSFGKVRLV